MGRRIFHHLLIVAMLALLGVVGYRLLTHFEAPTSPAVVDPLPPPQVDVALQQVRYTETREGVELWTLVADRVSLERATDLSSIEGIHLTFFGEGGQEEIRLEAREGSVFLERREVNVWGDVRAYSADGTEIRTERLTYEKSSGLLSSDDPVELRRPGLRMTGVGFTYEVEQRTLRLLSKVQADLWPELLRPAEN